MVRALLIRCLKRSIKYVELPRSAETLRPTFPFYFPTPSTRYAFHHLFHINSTVFLQQTLHPQHRHRVGSFNNRFARHRFYMSIIIMIITISTLLNCRSQALRRKQSTALYHNDGWKQRPRCRRTSNTPRNRSASDVSAFSNHHAVSLTAIISSEC